MRKTCFGLALAALASVTPAHATPTTYNFSGQLYQAYTGTSDPWPFAEGQSFSGSFTYDTAAITYSQTYIDQPDWQLNFHIGGITELQFRIDTPDGYHLSVPLSDPPNANVAVAEGTTEWEGAAVQVFNYPANGAPLYPVPDSAKLGNLYPHAVFLTLASYTDHGSLSDAGPDVDFAELFNRLEDEPYATTFTVRFTNPNSPSWAMGAESLDAVVYGNITSLTADATGVPEPAAWALMIVGFGAMGSAMRLARRNTGRSAFA